MGEKVPRNIFGRRRIEKNNEMEELFRATNLTGVINTRKYTTKISKVLMTKTVGEKKRNGKLVARGLSKDLEDNSLENKS